MLDLIGQIICFGAFAMPIVSAVIFWRNTEMPKWSKVILGLMVGPVIGFLMFNMSLAILFRNGLGPT